MERSIYLSLFDRDKLNEGYAEPGESLAEYGRALSALCRYREEVLSGRLSRSDAAKDWLLLRMHLELRRKKSAGEPSFLRVCRLLRLNAFERLLLLAASGQGAPGTAFSEGQERGGALSGELWTRLAEDRALSYPHLRALEELYAFWRGLEELPPEVPVFPRAGLFLEPQKDGKAPSPTAELRCRRRVRAELCRNGKSGAGQPEEPVLSGTLRFYARRVRTTGELPEVLIYQEQLAELKRMAGAANAPGGAPLSLILLGKAGSGKKLLAAHLAKSLSRNLLVIDGKALARYLKDAALWYSRGDAADWLDEFETEVLLSGNLVYLEAGEGTAVSLIREVCPGVMLFGAEDADALSGEKTNGYVLPQAVRLALPAPGAEEKARLWEAFLLEQELRADCRLKAQSGKDMAGTEKKRPDTGKERPDAGLLGSKYVLNAGEIRAALFAAEKHAAGEGKCLPDAADIAWAVHASQAVQLGSMAVQVPCVFGWEDLIVEPEVRRQLDYICNQVKYRSIVGGKWGFFEKMPYGRGLCALFYGPPGTGKTMAVQVVAGELGLDLYRIDLSQMISKYIGETEKNISALFEKAKHMNVILFFDEADALFAKRSEVKDSHDRNANAEVAHLLQQLEAYEGMTILATNLKDNIDDAFKRRVKFMVNFRFPGAETRKQLWHSLLPEKTPREAGLDLDFFAEHFELSGSQIKEILVNAAYIAAGDGTPLTNEAVKEALRLNYEKYGRKLTREDFGYLG